MKKTDNFFVIDNFNTVPTDLLEYCNEYLIYDSSTDEAIPGKLSELGLNYKVIPRTGQDITTWFRFFWEYYDALPEVMVLVKGHILGRHCTKEFFDRVYDNHYFTYLYEDPEIRGKINREVFFLASENQYLERNTSWYVQSENHPHKYFVNFNDLLRFIFRDPVIPEYCLFAPGACYIVRREQVLRHSKEFYRNLHKLMDYGLAPNAPIESHMIERMMPVLLESAYEVNEWMNDPEMFDKKISEEAAKVSEYDARLAAHDKTLKHRLYKMLFGH